jgi:putative phosphoserine phosphatase/1-acylglycerol-3-phosphate O-acyltransferase
MRPGTVDVAVLPPIDVSRWAKRDLDRRIEGVRALYVRALADWPRSVAPGGRAGR